MHSSACQLKKHWKHWDFCVQCVQIVCRKVFLDVLKGLTQLLSILTINFVIFDPQRHFFFLYILLFQEVPISHSVKTFQNMGANMKTVVSFLNRLWFQSNTNYSARTLSISHEGGLNKHVWSNSTAIWCCISCSPFIKRSSTSCGSFSIQRK